MVSHTKRAWPSWRTTMRDTYGTCHCQTMCREQQGPRVGRLFQNSKLREKRGWQIVYLVNWNSALCEGRAKSRDWLETGQHPNSNVAPAVCSDWRSIALSIYDWLSIELNRSQGLPMDAIDTLVIEKPLKYRCLGATVTCYLATFQAPSMRHPLSKALTVTWEFFPTLANFARPLQVLNSCQGWLEDSMQLDACDDGFSIRRS